MDVSSIENRACKWCGKYFVAIKSANTYCSNKCSETALRVRQRRNGRYLGKELRGVRPIIEEDFGHSKEWLDKSKNNIQKLSNHKYAMRLPNDSING
jgi:hypothetical protein